MAKITYEDKVALNVNSDIADVNKCNATDLNEIKNVVNTNDDNTTNNSNAIGNLSNLNTTNKNNLVSAINSIVESGSNANGNWIKYADGTMICTKTISAITPITSPWGALYESGDVILGQFPQAFISNPRVSVTNNSSAGALIEAVMDVTTTSAGKCWLCRGTSRDSQLPYVLDIIAIGRWK